MRNLEEAVRAGAEPEEREGLEPDLRTRRPEDSECVGSFEGKERFGKASPSHIEPMFSA